MLSDAYSTIRLYSTSLVVALLCHSFPVSAQEWSVSGFGSLGYSYENEPDIGYLRNISQPPDVERNGSFLPDSNLGLQLDFTWDYRWSATAQWVLEDRVEQDFNNVTELAFLRYLPDANWDLRLGRVGLNAYTAADSRRIDYAHLWVRPPQELYGSIFYDSIDGIDVTYRSSFNKLNWSASVQYGRISQVLEDERTNELSKASSDHTLAVALTFDYHEWSARFSYVDVADLVVTLGENGLSAQQGILQLANSGLGAVSSEAAEIYDQSDINGESVKYWQLGLGYFDGEWLMQTELFYVAGMKQAIPQGKGGYLMLGHNINRVTPYLIAAFFQPSSEIFGAKSDWGMVDPQLGQIQQLIVGGINATHIDQNSYSLGLRWDIHPQVALKGQVDFIQISEVGYGLWAADNRSSMKERDVQLYTLSVNFIF
ncbi:hypothetical protein LZU85_13180 [Vibrio sp. IRLE0018]|uniref:hypothetical protein n=1 Tax=Vibrio TaxID=662 RepID=UPI001593BFD5|nr:MULTISPECIES: hypothetical protein [Vibrio]MCF8779756.1 hypothetical protein [Vibrio floridensis]NVC63521.1 hypothetical protein [Vibrio sp. 05-20-BW147]HAS6348160.1 hypothetical protein [Vibrio vulnificus]